MDEDLVDDNTTMSESHSISPVGATDGTESPEPDGQQASGAHRSESTSWSPLVWPGLIFALLGSQAVLMLVMVFLATRDSSFAVEPDYYQKALHWDETAAQQRLNRQLGWSIHVTLSDETDIYKNRNVTCILLDNENHPISDASVEMIAFSHAQGNERFTNALEPTEIAGRYATRFRVAQGGIWEFRFVVQRGDETFTEKQEMRVTAVGEPQRWQR